MPLKIVHWFAFMPSDFICLKLREHEVLRDSSISNKKGKRYRINSFAGLRRGRDFHHTANLPVVIFLVFIRVPVPFVVQLYSMALLDVPKEYL